MTRYMVCLGACVLAWASGAFAADAPSPAAALVDKMPADTAEDGQKIAADLVKLGPAGVKEVAQMLLAPGTGNDAKPRFALNGLAYYVTRPGAETERAMMAAALLEALDAATDPLVKSFLISLLQLTGKEEAVEPLAKFLADADLGDPAARALVRINTPSVGPALLKALPAAKGRNLLSIIQALGGLRTKGAAAAILPYASDADAATRRAALDALANLGDPSAADALAKAAEVGTGYERAHATAMYLRFAARLAESGDKKAAAAICRDLVKTRVLPRENNVAADALATLAAAVGEEAVPDVLAATESENNPLRAAALEILRTMPGEAVTAKLIEQMKQAGPAAKAGVVGLLAKRGGKAASAAVLAAVKDPDKAVRLAAIEGAARVGSREAVEALLAALGTDQADERKAVQGCMARLTDPALPSLAAEAMAKLPPASRVAVVEILASREGDEATKAVLAATKDSEAPVRMAAIKALGGMPTPEAAGRLMGILLENKAGPERAEAEQSLGRIAGKRAMLDATILAGLSKAAGADRAALLKALGRTGSPRAMAAVVADTKSEDAAVQDAAIRALADWPTPAAREEVLKIARGTEKETHHVIALRGYLRMAATPYADSTVPMYKEALAVARRPDEKRMALAGLAALRDVEALKLIATYLDDEALAADATMAAVRCVLPQGPGDRVLSGADVMDIMKKVAAMAKDPKVREQAQTYVASRPRPDEANVARGKPVTASVAAQGPQKPELAVDGNATDLASSWWGEKWPASLTVDLQKPVKIDAVQVFFYWGGNRYYQYTVEVSADGQAWKKVADKGQNTAPATPTGVMLGFEPVEARYVRLNVLKGSANEAVHVVELKVFEAGK